MKRRQFIESLCALGAVAPLFTPSMAFAQSADDALLARVHPELRPIIKQFLPMIRSAPAPTRANLAQLRAGPPFPIPRLPEIAAEKRRIAGLAGQPPVDVVVLNLKKKAAPRPAILHTHGGGFIMGNAENEIPGLQRVCKELDCVIVSVDYRLAPETTYKGSIEDNYAGLKWLHDNAEELGVDASRIAVMGESAGGGHAALLAIAARDRGEVPVIYQCLTYPMLDDRTGSSRPVPPHVGEFGWMPANNRFGWESFLGMTPGTSCVPAAAVPARVENLKGLPPGFIGVGSIDLFHDEDVEYAQRLNEAGVATELIVVPGAFHGFDLPFIDANVSRWFAAARLDALRTGLGINAS